ncbi:MAG TPA: hypothetical protein VF240_13095 [Pyrinomonadaceae bacterium]
MATIWEKIKDNFTTLFVTTLVALLTVFSDSIVGNIKFAVNRANLRTTHYEKLATDLSNYTFSAENVTEFYEQGWTSKSSLELAVKPYNDAIVNLRKQEYVNAALLHRFWDADDVSRFKAVMETVREVDTQIHSLNSEAEAVANAVKPKADPAVTKPVTDKLKPLIEELKSRVSAFLSDLN